jgi:hypothetical protein
MIKKWFKSSVPVYNYVGNTLNILFLYTIMLGILYYSVSVYNSVGNTVIFCSCIQFCWEYFKYSVPVYNSVGNTVGCLGSYAPPVERVVQQACIKM